MIKAVILEKNAEALNFIHHLLDTHFLNVEVIGCYTNGEDFKREVKGIFPNLFLLDKDFQFSPIYRQSIPFTKENVQVVYTSFSSTIELVEGKNQQVPSTNFIIAVQKATERIFRYQYRVEGRRIVNEIKNIQERENKIGITIQGGVQYALVEDIVRCESFGKDTIIYLANKKRIVSTSSLSGLKILLARYGFVEVHNFHLINLEYISKYQRGEGGVIRMQDGAEIPLERKKKELFWQKLRLV